MPWRVKASVSAYLVYALKMANSTQPTRSCSPVPMATVAPLWAKMTELEVTPASTAHAKTRSSASCGVGLRAETVRPSLVVATAGMKSAAERMRFTKDCWRMMPPSAMLLTSRKGTPASSPRQARAGSLKMRRFLRAASFSSTPSSKSGAATTSK